MQVENIAKATDILRGEHEVILEILTALEKIARNARSSRELDLASADEALLFLQNFADRCHHGKEEQHLFPAIAARGLPRDVGPLAVMTVDHEEGRGLIARMRANLADARLSIRGAPFAFAEAADAYVELMRSHIAKENDVLFPMGDRMLTGFDQAELSAGFERFEHADMGAGAHARFLDIAHRLCARLGIEERTPPRAHGCCGHSSPCK